MIRKILSLQILFLFELLSTILVIGCEKNPFKLYDHYDKTINDLKLIIF